MPSSKKYKLFSPETAAGADEKPVCAFFASPAGCRNGDSCKFLHENPGGNKKKEQSSPVEIPENSSVVSSESEGGNSGDVVISNAKPYTVKNANIQLRSDDPFADVTCNKDAKNKLPSFVSMIDRNVLLEEENNKNNNKQGKDQQQNGNKEQQQSKRKKKRKANNEGDLFAAPKHASNKPEQNFGNVNDQHQEPPKKKAKYNNDVKDIGSAQTGPNFMSFMANLPVASFSSPDVQNTPIEKKDTNVISSATTAATAPENKSTVASKKPHRILPKSTAIGRKWHKAIIKSRQHDRYETSYEFERYKEIDARNGIQGEWIKAKPYGRWCEANPQAIAIDCEMLETTDPLSGAKNPRALCRLSVVNAEHPEEVLLDTLVKPTWPVTDYRTRINGVTKEHLDSVEFTLRHAQAFMMALCSEETVIIGHAVNNDLAALNMEHHVVADSSFLFRAKDSTTATVSLKDAVMSVMNVSMPDTHDSVNDARKALECVLHWMKNDGKVDLVERTPKTPYQQKGHQLFVHRIPKLCKPEHLSNMFLKHTSILPVDVEEIQFPNETGKTHVNFKSARHANLAFDTLETNADSDNSGRLQKKVYLRNGDYVRVRKMVIAKRPTNNNSCES